MGELYVRLGTREYARNRSVDRRLYLPHIMEPDHPLNAAASEESTVDNNEHIQIVVPREGYYRLIISHCAGTIRIRSRPLRPSRSKYHISAV